MDLNRGSLEHRVSPIHYFEAASAAMLEVSHFISFDPLARLAAAMAGLPLLPNNLDG
jgi:hypothetical protein